ncbi:hypothetical protein [Xanthobacter autotrophicus]|uniref:hypothetical protein n=1 Tax=Xanthobacter autotrophicus TaxID=280 RepID=UPI00372AC51C
MATGEDGVRFYTAQPLLPDFSHLARANRLQRRCRENDEYGNAPTERPRGDFLHLHRQSRQYHISRAVLPVHVGRSVPENIFASLVADLIALGQGLQQVAQLGEMPLRLMPTFSERTQRLI